MNPLEQLSLLSSVNLRQDALWETFDRIRPIGVCELAMQRGSE